MNKSYPYKENRRYINPHIPSVKRSLLDVFLWQIGLYNDKIPLSCPPSDFSYPNPNHPVHPSKPKVVWFGHSTFLIEIDGIQILTDPIWSDRCSPLSLIGPKRQQEIPLKIEELPPIDFVIISHDHYDHLDKKTVLALQKRSPHITWVTPEGLRKIFNRWGILKVIELSWWEKKTLYLKPLYPIELCITAVPSQHFSGRRGWDFNYTLWAGFVFDFKRKGKERKSFYFVGDTGYNAYDFKAIGEHFKGFDLSLIPIGTYVPRHFMSPVHIEPEHAVNIHQEVKSKLSVGMHWKTFRLSSEPMYQPPYDLFLAMKNAALDPLSFRVLEIGQQINW